MKLFFFIIELTLWISHECHWRNVNKTDFCNNLLSCSTTDGNAHTIPQIHQVTDENLTESVCELAPLCYNNTNGVSSDTSETERNDNDNVYPLETNRTEFCSILNACDNNGDTHSDMDPLHYLQNLTQYCPYTEFCGLNATKPLASATSVPCCLPCSCSPDCGLRHDCCLPSLDKHHVIQTEHLTCVTVPIMPTGNQFGLYMYDKYPNGTECFIPTPTQRTPLPVSSSVTHRIYINRECAEGNSNIPKSDFTDWSIHVPTEKNLNIADCLSGKMDCSFGVIIPPMHWQWVIHFGCGRRMVDSCPDDYTNQPVIDACNKVHAPFYQRYPAVVYSNVHCLVCTKPQNLYQALDLCDDLGTGIARGSFSMILDMRLFHVSKEQRPSCKETPAELRDKIGCRDVVCPDTMLRVDGICQYFIKHWSRPPMSFQFILKPHDTIETKLFLNMTKSDRYSIDQWVSTGCGLKLQSNTNTNIHSKLYMLSIKEQNKMIVKEFLLRLNYIAKGIVKPSQFLPAIDRCVKGRWKMLLDGNFYFLSVSLYRYRSYMPDGHTKRIHLSLNRSLSESPLARVYEPITIGYLDRPNKYVLQFNPGSFAITKLMFCERIKLQPGDVELLFFEIRIKASDRLLGNSEFEIMYDDIGGKPVVGFFYVCLDDYLPESTNVGHYTGSSVWTVLISVMLIWTYDRY